MLVLVTTTAPIPQQAGSRPTRASILKNTAPPATTDTPPADISPGRSVRLTSEREPGEHDLPWRSVGATPIDEVSDDDLAAFCIGKSVIVAFPPGSWPDKKWKNDTKTYVGEIFNSRRRGGSREVQVVCASPDPAKKTVWTFWLPVSPPNASRNLSTLSLRQALVNTFPNQRCLWDVTSPAPHVSPAKKLTRRNNKGRIAKAYVASTDRHANLTARGPITPLLTWAYIACLNACLAEDNSHTSAFAPTAPRTYNECTKRSDYNKWLQGMQTEMDTLLRQGTWVVSDYDPSIPIVPSKWTYALKTDQDGNILRYKGRVVARGDRQGPESFDETTSPTARAESIRTMLAYACQERMHLKQFDITAAFVSADLDRPLQMQPPPGFPLPPGKCYLLKKSLYGLRQASNLYHKKLLQWHIDHHFEVLNEEGTFFRLRRGNDCLLIQFYVDDGICACSSTDIFDDYILSFSKTFTLSSHGDLKYYLGIEVDYDREKGTLRLCQQKYIHDLLNRFDMLNCAHAATPAVPNEYLTNEGCIDRATPENIPTIRKYQTLVGALLYLSGWSRPDIAAAVSSCSRFLAGPSPAHITAAKRILRYLAGTSDLCICYRRSPATNPYINTLFGYCDADHAGAPDDRLSVTGFMYFMNGGPISWCSKRQPIVALSSTEAEFYAASQAGNAAIVLRRLLEAMGIPQQGPTVVMEDNAACIFMAHRPGELKRAKHIDTRIYRLREMTRDGIILLAKVLTEFQVADIFTKALPTILFERHRSTFLSR